MDLANVVSLHAVRAQTQLRHRVHVGDVLLPETQTLGVINVSVTKKEEEKKNKNKLLVLKTSAFFLHLKQASDHAIQDVPLGFTTHANAANQKMPNSAVLWGTQTGLEVKV